MSSEQARFAWDRPDYKQPLLQRRSDENEKRDIFLWCRQHKISYSTADKLIWQRIVSMDKGMPEHMRRHTTDALDDAVDHFKNYVQYAKTRHYREAREY